MSRIYLPFASGHLVEIGVHLYKAPADRPRLLDAYVTTECEGAVTRSARRAAEAILNWLPIENRPKEAMVVAFDLSGLPTDQTVTGESGGLAMAVALAAKFVAPSAAPIAVTGILADGNANTPVLAVQGISKKIEGALGALPSGCVVLYPAANKKEIRSDLLELAKTRSLKLQPCITLADTLNDLFDVVPPRATGPKTVRSRWFWATLLAGSILLVLFALLSGREGGRPSLPGSEEAQQVMETPQPPDKENESNQKELAPAIISKENPEAGISEAPSQPTSTRQKVTSGKGFD